MYCICIVITCETSRTQAHIRVPVHVYIHTAPVMPMYAAAALYPSVSRTHVSERINRRHSHAVHTIKRLHTTPIYAHLLYSESP